MIALASRPCRAPYVVTQEAPQGAILLGVPTGRTCVRYAMNEQAHRVWELCDGTRTVAEIIGLLRGEYDTSDQPVMRDVLDLLRELASERLVNGDGWTYARRRTSIGYR